MNIVASMPQAAGEYESQRQLWGMPARCQKTVERECEKKGEGRRSAGEMLMSCPC